MILLEKIRRLTGHTLLLEETPKPTTWKCEQIHHVLLLSGVFDIREHYKYESRRAVEGISPMATAMRSTTFFAQYSPTTIIRHCSEVEDHNFINGMQEYLPSIAIVHALEDKTVPYTSSLDFYDALKKLKVSGLKRSLLGTENVGVHFHLVPNISHPEMAFALMESSKEGEQILKYLEELKDE
jgi:hypothetical protein